MGSIPIGTQVPFFSLVHPRGILNITSFLFIVFGNFSVSLNGEINIRIVKYSNELKSGLA